MDGLLIILAILGLISSLGKKKKQQRETMAQYRRDNSFEEAFPEDETAVPPAKPVQKATEAAKKVDAALKKVPEPVKKAIRQEIPFTKEEWDKFLSGIEGKKPAAQDMPKSSPEGRISKHQPLAEGASLPLKSTQGESHEEHKKHLEKIAAEEKQRHEQAELAREIRHMNRQKLRQAIVMSEVLGKPVALRGKR